MVTEDKSNATYLLLLTMNESLSFVVSTLFMILIICSKILHDKKAKIRTIIFYILFYEFAAFLVTIDGISDNYNLYDQYLRSKEGVTDDIDEVYFGSPVLPVTKSKQGGKQSTTNNSWKSSSR